MLSDKISILCAKTIDLVNGSNETFNTLLQSLEKRIDYSTVVECSAVLKTHSGNLGKI